VPQHTGDEQAARGLSGGRYHRQTVAPVTVAWPPVPWADGRVRAWDGWADRYAAWDPGLNRLRAGLQAVLVIGAILGAEALFVHFTQALYIQAHGAALPPAEAARIAAADHELLVLAMLLGAAVGLTSIMEVVDQTASGQLISLLMLPVPMIAALALGIAIGGYRIPALASFAVVVAIGTYGRRFGPRGSIAMMLFFGDFSGYLLHTVLTLHDLGWLVAEIELATAAAIAVRFVFFYPRAARALRRTQRSYAARVRKVAALALGLLDGPRHTERDARPLHRQLLRLNEAALMIDAHLGDPGAVPADGAAQLLHQRLFDAELALANIARFAEAMAAAGLSAAQRVEARLALRDLIRGDREGAKAHAGRLTSLLPGTGAAPPGEDRAAVVVIHRFAGSVTALADAITEWTALGTAGEGEGAFQPSVRLHGGWLPGSAHVSSAASRESGARRGDRARLAPYTRTAIQVGLAVGAAAALGDVLSPGRFYWAVLAALFTFLGANTTGEQVRKACFRIAGTVVGIVAGSLLVSASGHDAYWSIVVILAAFFFAVYVMRINYSLMVIGITVMVSQLYQELGEFSNALLLLRLEETAVGAAVAIVVVTLVLPLRTRRVLSLAFRDLVQAVSRLAGDSSEHLLGEDDGLGAALRSDARAVDAAYQALTATAKPLRRTLTGAIDEGVGQALRLAYAARNYSRNLAADTQRAGSLDAATRPGIQLSSAVLKQSMDAVTGALSGTTDGVYIRSSALFDQAERRTEESSGIAHPARLAILDLMLIDGTMAQIAERLGLPVTDYDTVPPGPAIPGGPGGARARGRVHGLDGGGIRATPTLTGTVTTASGGHPVPDARITLVNTTGAVVAAAGTDEAGQYVIEGLPDGEYTAIISSYPPAASTLHITGLERTVRHDIELRHPRADPGLIA
jgi:uncharacterized membrane protein YgaE (UPF0421/DUF939 family)